MRRERRQPTRREWEQITSPRPVVRGVLEREPSARPRALRDRREGRGVSLYNSLGWLSEKNGERSRACLERQHDVTRPPLPQQPWWADSSHPLGNRGGARVRDGRPRGALLAGRGLAYNLRGGRVPLHVRASYSGGPLGRDPATRGGARRGPAPRLAGGRGVRGVIGVGGVAVLGGYVTDQNDRFAERRELVGAGWEPKETEGTVVWKNPSNDYWYPHDLALQ